MTRFGYKTLAGPDKGLIRRDLERTTGYPRAQLTRLLRRQGQDRSLSQNATPRPGRASGGATRRPVSPCWRRSIACTAPCPGRPRARCWSAVQVYGDARFELLAAISGAHLYNLRKRTTYESLRPTGPRPAPIRIGTRKPPRPDGRRGFIRIDPSTKAIRTHQRGSITQRRGLRHAVELVPPCGRISEALPLPALETLQDGFPFTVRGLHADNGGEYINPTVAARLSKLNIDLTRSRPRGSNDKALAESRRTAPSCANIWATATFRSALLRESMPLCTEHLNPYLKLHRPCFFAIEKLDAKGKIRRLYPHDQSMTPFAKLKSLPAAARPPQADHHPRQPRTYRSTGVRPSGHPTAQHRAHTCSKSIYRQPKTAV